MTTKSTKFIVECPDCKVRFFVTEELLSAAYGVLRCGFCSHVFNGKDHIVYQTYDSSSSHSASVEPELPVSEQDVSNEVDEEGDGEVEVEESPAYWHDVVDTLSSFSISFKPIDDDKEVIPKTTSFHVSKKMVSSVSENASAATGDVDISHVDADIVERIEHIDFDQLLTQDEQSLLVQEANVAVEDGSLESVVTSSDGLVDDVPKDIYGNSFKKVTDTDFFVETAPPKKSKSVLVWSFLSLLAVLCLVGQYVRFVAPEMALKEDSRAFAEKACQFLLCDIPPLVDVSKIKTKQLVVSESQKMENILNVDAIVESNLSIAQPYPIIELRFTDLNGQPVASRRFLPHEYLNDEIMQKNQMQPNVPTYISFEVVDPGETAVGYSLYYYSAN